jgi:5'-3' exonuclease
MGDPSDNIKGLYMYGPVKSKKFVENLKENFVKLSSEEKELLKHNLKMINLKNGLETYPDEEEYYESQDIQPEPNMTKFFDIIDKLGIKNYIGYRSEWNDHFGKNKSNIVEGLQNILKNINN